VRMCIKPLNAVHSNSSPTVMQLLHSAVQSHFDLAVSLGSGRVSRAASQLQRCVSREYALLSRYAELIRGRVRYTTAMGMRCSESGPVSQVDGSILCLA
jgi:hypothetical protein